MNPDIKQRWVEALRSGEYQKDTGRLRTPEGYCCLGVLTDLYLQETGETWDIDSVEFGYYIGKMSPQRYVLPDSVVEWAGLSSIAVSRKHIPEQFLFCWSSASMCITTLNDRVTTASPTFEDIADVIEKAF